MWFKQSLSRQRAMQGLIFIFVSTYTLSWAQPPDIQKLYGIPEKGYRWPKGVVPYVVGPKFNENELDFIKAAIKAFRIHTCIKFIKRSGQKDYISIEKKPTGCWSSLGRRGGMQKLNLQKECLLTPGPVMHQLMHTIGFLHEHNRSDRDKYVKINFKNIIPGQEVNFQKWNNTEHFGLPYDYDSITHYSTKAFSRNNKTTIKARKAKYNHRMGQIFGFSYGDISRVNAMYKCTTYKRSTS